MVFYHTSPEKARRGGGKSAAPENRGYSTPAFLPYYRCLLYTNKEAIPCHGSAQRGEAVPPHPRPEPRFEGDLTADRIRWIFRDSADFGERPVLIGGDPAKRTTVFFLNGQVRNERMNDYILRPLATSPLLREATPQAAFRMMTEGIVYTQLVQVCTTLDQAVFALINGSVVFAFPGEGG